VAKAGGKEGMARQEEKKGWQKQEERKGLADWLNEEANQAA